MEEDVERKAWNEYSEDLYNGDTEEQAAVNRCAFDRARKVNYFGRGLLRKAEV